MGHVHFLLYFLGCTNKFARVEYNSATSIISCVFRDQLNTTGRLCTVMYGHCHQELVQSSEGYTTAETPNTVMLRLMLSGLNQEYCYVVTASNGTNTVIVKGSIRKCTL